MTDLAEFETIAEVKISPDGETIAYCVATADRDFPELRLTSATAGAGPPPKLDRIDARSPRWSPDARSLAFLTSGEGGGTQVRLLALAEGRQRVLASFAGEVGPVAWSPAGDRIALSAAASIGSATRIAVIATATGSAQQVPAGEGDDSAPSWSPDGATLAFSRARRKPGKSGPSSSIYLVRPGRGADPVAVETDLAFAGCPSWSPCGRWLACYGTRGPRLGLDDPALQPWIVPAAGGPARPAARGVNGVIVPSPPEGPIWSADGSSIFFREARAGAIGVVRADANPDADAAPLTGDCQVTDFSLSDDGKRLAFAAGTPTDPGSLYVREDASSRHCPGASRAKPPKADLPGVEHRIFESPHGYDLDGWVQGLGAGSAPRPLLVCMHGGPHGFVGPGFQLGHYHRSVLASRGWLVLTLNSSGSGSYGEAFADSIRGRWGEYDLPEYLAATDDLIEEGLADPERLGLAGYSYGGYLAAWAVCHTNRFKAAAIGAPITDIESFCRTSDIGPWYGPWEMKADPGAIEERASRLSPATHASRIETPTLVLHGEDDERCPIAQSEALLAAMSAAGRARAEFVRYPGADHLFYSRGRLDRRIDYNRRIVNWFEENVQATGARGTR